MYIKRQGTQRKVTIFAPADVTYEEINRVMVDRHQDLVFLIGMLFLL